MHLAVLRVPPGIRDRPMYCRRQESQRSWQGGALRFSLSEENTLEELDVVVEELSGIVEKLRGI